MEWAFVLGWAGRAAGFCSVPGIICFPKEMIDSTLLKIKEKYSGLMKVADVYYNCLGHFDIQLYIILIKIIPSGV